MSKPKGNLEALTVPKGETVTPHQPLKTKPADSDTPPSINKAAPAGHKPAREATHRGATTSLTLRLDGGTYDRLRTFAFKHRRTHQDILAAALVDYLDRQ